MWKSRLYYTLEKLYNLLVHVGSYTQSIFLLYMRLVWGHQFFLAGWQKFGHIEQLAAFFSSLHIIAPLFHAYLVASFETLCGVCIFFGLASRLAAIPMAIILLTALSTAHAPELSNFRFLFEPLQLVRQAPYPFLITALLVFAFGPGKISLDHWIQRRIQKMDL
jgi:putative oxidoreductase